MALKDRGDWFVRRDPNLWASIFLLIFSIVVATEAYRLGIGRFRAPGPGFLVFGASGLLGFLSVHLCLKAIFKGGYTGKFVLSQKGLRRVLPIGIGIAVYNILLEPFGFQIATFLFLIFVFKTLGFKKWIWVVLTAAFTTVLSYFIFSNLLALQFPKGLFRFL